MRCYGPNCQNELPPSYDDEVDFCSEACYDAWLEEKTYGSEIIEGHEDDDPSDNED